MKNLKLDYSNKKKQIINMPNNLKINSLDWVIHILFIMSAFGNGKKRRQQAQINNRLKQVKGVSKPTIEDIYPFDVPNLQAIPHEVRNYINELERQYI